MRLLGYALALLAFAGTASAQQLDIPEIDPATATSALTLLVGGYLIVVSKARRK